MADKKPCALNFMACEVLYDGKLYEGILDFPKNASVETIIETFADFFVKLNGLDAEGCCPEDGVTKGGAPTTKVVQGRKSDCYYQLKNLGFKYSFRPSGDRVLLEWNFDDVVNNLPTGYRASYDVKVYSNNTSGNRSLISSGGGKVGSVSIRSESMPVYVDFGILLNTPCGTLKLEKNVFNNATSIDRTGVFAINDLTGQNVSEITQESFNEQIRVEIDDLKNQIDSCKTLEVGNLNNVNYSDNQTNNVVSQHGSLIDDLYDKINSLEGAPGNDFDSSSLQSQIDSMESLLAVYKDRLDRIQSELAACCNGTIVSPELQETN